MAKKRRGGKVRPKPRRTVVRRKPGKPRRPRKPTRVKPKPRRGPKAKPTRVKRPAAPALRLVERIVYRDKRGHLVKKGTRGARKFTYTVQVDERGRQVRLIEKTTPTTIIKTADVDRSGIDMGRIDWALVKSSATSIIGRGGVSMIEVTLKARDSRGKERRFKLVMDLEAVKRKRKLYEAIVGRILDVLRGHGFRTNYTIELFKKARQKGLKYPITWDEWRELEPLHDMEMIVTIFRR